MSSLTISPEEEKRLKGLGFINNKNTDNFSARVITGGGRLTADQMDTLSSAARQFGDGHVVFTTRLCAEIPGIPYEKIEAFSAYLDEHGMATGGTGNLVRPIVCCKATTCKYGLLDSYAIAEQLHRRFYLGYHQVPLPHKFKIAVGGCPNSCIKPDLNDLGIMGWRGGFKVFIGGRWGKKHSEGRALSRIIPTEEELYALVEKTILYYKENGQPGERFCETIARIGFETVEKALLGEA